MFGSTIGWKSLGMTCRSLSTMLHSGIAVRKSFEVAARRTGDARCARALRGVEQGIAQGQDVSEAMQAQNGAFPDLLVDMVSMAEKTGALPEVLERLADHYENNVRLRRAFVGQIAWPTIQLVAAVMIVAVVIWVMGMLPESKPDDPFDFSGMTFGLRGERGALTWLGTIGAVAGMGLVVFLLVQKSLAARKVVDPILLKVPILGNCLRSFAIARFSWAYFLTQQTGMPVHRSLAASLRATGNGAFIGKTRLIGDAVKSGESLGDALDLSGLFPEEYIHTVHVAESSGTVPESLDRLSPQFEDQARRSLSILTSALAWSVWVMVAGFIIFLIFRFVLMYVNGLNNLMKW